jgi:hypothetical protein
MIWVGVVFWGGIWAIAIVAILLPVLREREMQKTLRHAIEKGQTLDPAIVETLLATSDKAWPNSKSTLTVSQNFLIGGAIILALGLGAMMMGWFIAQLAPKAFYPIFGGGVVLCILGAAFLLLSRLLGSRKGASPGDA